MAVITTPITTAPRRATTTTTTVRSRVTAPTTTTSTTVRPLLVTTTTVRPVPTTSAPRVTIAPTTLAPRVTIAPTSSAPATTTTSTKPSPTTVTQALPTTTTVGSTTTSQVLTPSTQVDVSIAAPVSDLSQPVLIKDELPKAEPENPIVVQTGDETSWDVVTINRRVVQMRDNGNFRLSVTAVDDTGELTEVNTRGAIVVTHGHYLTVSGDGYRPGTEVVAWLFSTPRRLGTLRVTADGSFESRLLVDSTVEFGEHTAQVNGYTAVGDLRSLNLAVEVVDPSRIQPRVTEEVAIDSARRADSSRGAWSQSWLAVVGLGVGVVAGWLLSEIFRRYVLVGVRRRRNDD